MKSFRGHLLPNDLFYLVEKNKSIEIVNLYLEDYSFLLAISTEEFSDLYSKTLETISNYYEQG